MRQGELRDDTNVTRCNGPTLKYYPSYKFNGFASGITRMGKTAELVNLDLLQLMESQVC